MAARVVLFALLAGAGCAAHAGADSRATLVVPCQNRETLSRRQFERSLDRSGFEASAAARARALSAASLPCGNRHVAERSELPEVATVGVAERGQGAASKEYPRNDLP